MEFSQSNYLAVGLSKLLAFILGVLWYSPLLFAKAAIRGTAATRSSSGTLNRRYRQRETDSRSRAIPDRAAP